MTFGTALVIVTVLFYAVHSPGFRIALILVLAGVGYWLMIVANEPRNPAMKTSSGWTVEEIR